MSYIQIGGGERLLRAGDLSGGLYKIVTGAIKRTDRTGICEVLFPGDVFDLPELLAGRRHSNDAHSLSLVQTQLEVIERQQVLACRSLLEEGNRKHALREESLRRFRAARSSGSIQQRAVLVMLLLAARGGRPAGCEQKLPFELSAGELAELTGASPRVLDEFQRHGLFRQDSSGATFLSTGRLLESCHCLPGTSVFQCWQRCAAV